MTLKIIRNDIGKVKADIIVNSCDYQASNIGGAEGSLYTYGGQELLLARKKLGELEVGEVVMTPAFKLNSKYVFHTVGPIWQDGKHNEEKLLAECYNNALSLAIDLECNSIAFPLISTGLYGYPKDKAFKLALKVIEDFLIKEELKVYLVVYDSESYLISKQLFNNIQEYIDDNYFDEQIYEKQVYNNICSQSVAFELDELTEVTKPSPTKCNIQSLDISLKQDIGFSEYLLKLIDKSGKDDSYIYKKANIDRKLFSKIRSNPAYQPSKPTAIAFAIALELDLKQTNMLLAKAGYTLTRSRIFDIIIEYFILNGDYNIHNINEALYAFDQNILS